MILGPAKQIKVTRAWFRVLINIDLNYSIYFCNQSWVSKQERSRTQCLAFVPCLRTA